MKNLLAMSAILLTSFTFGCSKLAFAQDLTLDAQPRLQFLRGSFAGSSRFEYFTTSSNFNATGGAYTQLANGNKLNHLLIGFRGYYDVSSKWSVYGLGAYSRVDSRDNEFRRDNFGFTELGLGTRFRLLTDLFAAIPELEFSYPLRRIDRGTDEAIETEGVMGVRIGSWFESKLAEFVIQTYLGYIIRDEGRANLFKWQAGFYLPYEGFRIGTALGGYRSVTDDQYKNRPEMRTDVTHRVNGGSMRFFSVNPSWNQFEVYAGYEYGKMVLATLGYQSIFNGANAARGSAVVGQIRLQLEGFDEAKDPSTSIYYRERQIYREHQREQELPRLERVDEVKESPKTLFVPENERYDTDAFKEAEDEIKPMEIKMMRKKPAVKKPRIRKKTGKRPASVEDAGNKASPLTN